MIPFGVAGEAARNGRRMGQSISQSLKILPSGLLFKQIKKKIIYLSR